MAGKIVDVTLRMVDKISGPLNSIGQELAHSANEWKKAGRQITGVGRNIESTGQSLTTSLTLPVVGLGTAAVKVAAEFEAGMSKVQSICGASSAELDELSAKAIEMGKITKFSMSETADAFSYMAMAGWKTEDMLSGISGVMYLAGATGSDLATTSDIVTDAMTAFGMAASESNVNLFVDTLAKTASNASTDVLGLGESFKYVAPVAGALGFNVQDVSVALGAMANSSIKGSQAGTALRTWMANMTAPTKEMQVAMDTLGLSVTKSDGSMKSLSEIMGETRSAFSKLSESQKSQYASTLAGKEGMSGLLAIVNSSESDFSKLTDAIYNSSGACQEMYEVANNNLIGQITELKSLIEAIGVSFGNRLTPYVKMATEWIRNMSDKFEELSTEQQDMIIKIGLVAAAVGPALMVFGKMTIGIGNVVFKIGKLGSAFKTFGSIAGIIASPAGIVIGVLAGIAVAGVLVYKNWDKIKETASNVFGFVKSIFSDIGISSDSLKEKLFPIGEKFEDLKGKIGEFWTVAEPIITKIGSLATVVFQGVLGAAIGGAIGYFNSMLNSAINIAGGLMTTFGGIIDFLTGVFSGDWAKAWGGIKDVFSGVFISLSELVKAPLNAVIGVINGTISGINKIGIKIPDWVPGLGGKDFSINIPMIPALAKGTDNWSGGLAQISEKGGEIVDLPSGSRVYPHDESVRKAYAEGSKKSGNVIVNIPKLADQIVVRSEEDIDAIARKLADKLEKVSKNLGGGEIGYVY